MGGVSEGKMTPEDSDGFTGATGGVGAAGVAQVGSIFQVQIHPGIPVSIVWVIPGSVISPQVHVQFHVQVDGSGEEACAAALVGAGSGPGELDAGVVGADRPACAGC